MGKFHNLLLIFILMIIEDLKEKSIKNVPEIVIFMKNNKII